MNSSDLGSNLKLPSLGCKVSITSVYALQNTYNECELGTKRGGRGLRRTQCGAEGCFDAVFLLLSEPGSQRKVLSYRKLKSL